MDNRLKDPDLETVRSLLLAAFTARELRHFCLARPIFRPIVDYFSSEHGLRDMVDEVIEYCRVKLLWPELLAEIQKENPRQYARFAPLLGLQERPTSEASSQPDTPKSSPGSPPEKPPEATLVPDHSAAVAEPVGAATTLPTPPVLSHQPPRAGPTTREKILKNWTRGQIIAVIGLLVTIVACSIAVMIVPEVRQWLGLEIRATSTPTTPIITVTNGTRPTNTPTPSGTPTPTDTPTTTWTPTNTPTTTWTPTSTPTPIPTRIRSNDGAVMVYVPAGEFTMGSVSSDADERPVHIVTLKAFWIDKFEVTNAQYRRCVAEGGCTPSLYDGNSKYNGDRQPVVGVNWAQAIAYCSWAEPWAKGRLPTEAEWEKAARGPEGWLYPWGDALDFKRLNSNKNVGADTYDDAAAPVGSFPDGASLYGAMDMSGNVEEWTSSLYKPYPYIADDGREDPNVDGSATRVVRGGSWFSPETWLTAAWRTHYTRGSRKDQPYTGFRCAVSAGN